MENSLVEEASMEASEQLQSLLNNDDVDKMKRLQLLILGRLQDCNAVLSHYNDFSERSYGAVDADFHKNTRLLKSMKNDLDYVFQHLRMVKSRIAKHFPDAFVDSMDVQGDRGDSEGQQS